MLNAIYKKYLLHTTANELAQYGKIKTSNKF